MSELTDKGNRWVCIMDGRKCSTCYYYGTECYTCSYKKINSPPNVVRGGIMTFDEYKKHNGTVFSTYEVFRKDLGSFRFDDDYSDEEEIDGYRMSGVYN